MVITPSPTISLQLSTCLLYTITTCRSSPASGGWGVYSDVTPYKGVGLKASFAGGAGPWSKHPAEGRWVWSSGSFLRYSPLLCRPSSLWLCSSNSRHLPLTEMDRLWEQAQGAVGPGLGRTAGFGDRTVHVQAVGLTLALHCSCPRIPNTQCPIPSLIQKETRDQFV